MPISTFLNGRAPTQLRGLAWLALSDVGQVGTGVVTSDSGGGGTTTWTYGTSVPCRVDPILADESVAGSRLDDRSTHTITLPAETPVSPSSRFLIAGRGTFEVTAVQLRTGELARFLEAVQVS